LPPHRGPYAGILRCHVGIKIPKRSEGCRIRVGDTWRHWEKGKVLIFDDSRGLGDRRRGRTPRRRIAKRR
jgi:beta-hydroxylase